MAVLLVPQAMAYAALAGMPPQAGLHAAIVSLVVYAALGSSRLLMTGPAPLIVMLLTTGLVAVLALDQQGVRVVGEVPAEPPVPVLPHRDASLLRALAPGALLIAVVSWLESSAVARTYAGEGDRLHPQRELWALGAADVAAGLVRGFPGASGLARTAVVLASGRSAARRTLTHSAPQ